MMGTLMATLGFLFFTGLIQWLVIQKVWNEHDPRRPSLPPHVSQLIEVESGKDGTHPQRPGLCLWKISRDENA